MRAQACLCRASGDATEGAQRGGRAEKTDAQRLGECGGKAVEDHGGVVEDVGDEAPALALGFEGEAEARGEEDGGDAAGGVLENGEEEGGCGGGGGVADADAWGG